MITGCDLEDGLEGSDRRQELRIGSEVGPCGREMAGTVNILGRRKLNQEALEG